MAADLVVDRTLILVVEVDDLADACLRQELCALMAGEKRHIDRRALHVLQAPPEVQDRVCLGVHDIAMLVIQRIVRGAPREIVVVDSGRGAVIADAQDAVVRVSDAGTDLGIGILAAELCRDSDPHEELVPRDDISALVRHGQPLSCSDYLYRGNCGA